MTKHLLTGGVLLLALVAVTPALAAINPEPFLPEAGYIAGTALSAFYWDGNPGVDTTGVLDIEDVGGNHGLVVKLTADGPETGSSFPPIIAQAGPGWGGPSRRPLASPQPRPPPSPTPRRTPFPHPRSPLISSIWQTAGIISRSGVIFPSSTR